MKRHNCQARQESDQMRCVPCGLVWDMNDPDPPECRKHIKRAAAKGLPVDLPSDVAAAMVKTYQANAGGLSGMRAAYRLFLDRV